MLVLDYTKGVAKQRTKQGFSCHPLLERRKRVKRRERPEVKKTIFTLFYWGFQNGQEVVPPFWATNFQILKSAKTTIFCIFGEKTVLERGQKQKTKQR